MLFERIPYLSRIFRGSAILQKLPVSILAVDDEETLLHMLTHVLQQNGYYIDTAPDGRVAITMLETLPYDVVLLDFMMPNIGGMEVLKYIKSHHFDSEVIMITAVQDVKTAVECMRLGAFYYITKPYNIADLIALIERALERKRLLVQNKALRRQVAHRALPSSMAGNNKSLLEMLDLALKAAPTDSAVLIQGASGTGKEVLANFVHTNSSRSESPLLALNCSSHTEAMIESELFGSEKGAIAEETVARQGLLEIVNGGTIFLDEIAEMPLTVQPKLLRFLQSGEFRRVGSNKNLKSDVRVISATNRDLRQEVAEGRFREDLLLRLGVISLQIPALKDRREDIPVLVEQFLRDHAGMKEPKRLDEHALGLLMKYDWPGNVRELENVIERAAILSEQDIISAEDLALRPPGDKGKSMSTRTRTKGKQIGSSMTLAELQKAHMKSVLESVEWDKRRAARILGISLKDLASKMKTHKLTGQR
jgi:two-component system, NtrC family, response regulator AtoC